MDVAKINNPEELRGLVMGNTLCNPVQDANDNWIISMIEAEFLPVENYQIITWVPREESE